LLLLCNNSHAFFSISNSFNTFDLKENYAGFKIWWALIGSVNQIKRAIKIPNYRNDNIIVLPSFSGVTNLLSEFIKQSKTYNWIVYEQLRMIIKDNHLRLILSSKLKL